MRYLTFSTAHDPTPRLGVAAGDRVIDLQTIARAVSAEPPPASLLDLIASGHATWRRVADMVNRAAPSQSGAGVPMRDIRWHAPIPRPTKNIFCVGRNFVAHAAEGARARGVPVKLPTVPLYFTKAPTTVIGPYDEVPWHQSATQQVDWEAELAVIIGVRGCNIRRESALEHVFGYTIANDVTARDLQDLHGQFFKGKSLDGSCPMGPVVVTAEEYGDPHAKDIALRVNGVVKQQGNTRDLIFRIDVLIESLSHGLTLEPGDIIATGTPEGCGFARTPPEFLQVDDIMETEVEGIGAMRNRVVARP
ncbi:MAG: fumarylacetoacetate hydrolase family protein [Acidobacteria bacterium]|nr:fumarylacetoacetate hydrolase family protein [Acidobacteriota bacterium]